MTRRRQTVGLPDATHDWADLVDNRRTPIKYIVAAHCRAL